MRPEQCSIIHILRLTALLACAATTSLPALGQAESVFRPARGFQPSGSYAVTDLDSVNNVTGGVTVRIPVAKVAGRNGSGFSLDLVYNSALFNLQTQLADVYRVIGYDPNMGNVSLNMLNVSNGGGWRYNHRYSLDMDSRGGTIPSNRVTLIAGDGGSHQLWLRVPTAGQNDSDGFSQFDMMGKNILGTDIGPNLTYYTTDGSFIRVEVVVGNTWTAYFPNGDYVTGPIRNNNPKDADKICDRNANCSHIVNQVDGVTLWISTTEIADDFGRKIVISYSGDPNAAGVDHIRALPFGASTTGTWGDPRNQSSPLMTTVTWNTIFFGPAGGVTANNATSGITYECPEAGGGASYTCINSFSLRMVTEVELPNALKYNFTYADDTAGNEKGQGELREIKLPTKTGETTRAEMHYYWSRKEHPIVNSVPTAWLDANINPVSKKVVTFEEENEAGVLTSNCGTGVGCATWTYGFGTTDVNGNFSAYGDRSVITAPDGSVTTQYFYNRTDATTWSSGLVYKETTSTGNMWRCWEKNEPWIGVSAAADPKNPFVRMEFRQQLPTTSDLSETWFDYDKNGNLITKREYDWIAAPANGNAPSCEVSGTVLRRTENKYWNPPGGATVAKAADPPTIGLTSAYWNTANHKRDSVLETRVYKGESTVAAVSQFQYDNADTTGNLRYEYRWDDQLSSSAPTVAQTGVTLSASSAAVSERQYDSGYGLITKEIDPSGNMTQYTYSSVANCPTEIANIYPTLISSPEGQTRKYNYDCATGLVKDEIVTSNQNLTAHSDYDRYGRVTSTATGSGLGSPNEHTTSTEYYDGARRVRVVTDGLLGRVSYFNQLGALYRESENADDAVSAIGVGSTHDIRTVSGARMVPSIGTYSLTSNPYVSDGSATGWALRLSDAAGRTTDVYYYPGATKPAPFGNTSVSPTHETYRYSGLTTTFTDPSGRSRETTVDALGRVKSASEGVLSSASYGYDALDNLTSVTMVDSTSYPVEVTQTRTFGYSSLGRLVSATNPESGTTTYTYYPNGALHTKTDALNRTVTHIVDGLNRIKKKDYTVTTPVTPAVRYCYDGDIYQLTGDQCVVDSTRAADYAQGALTDAVTLSGNSVVSETKYAGIDAQGRVTDSIQKTTGLADMPFSYQYSATGELKGVHYPSGRWVTYDLNGAARVKAVRSGQSGASYYLQNANYKADGSFSTATVGLDSGNQWAETWFYNSRLQPCTMQVQKGIQTPLLALQWKHSTADLDGVCEGASGTDNNGNVQAERLQYPNSGVPQTVLRSYGYDNANRLTSYSEPNPFKSQLYGYDAFGNIWQTGTPVGVPDLRANGPSWYLQNGNSVSNRLNNTQYDAAGHQQQLSASPGTVASYDAEDRLSMVTWTGGGTAIYDYDAEGRRVRRTVSGVTTYFVYDANGQLMAEYNGTGTTTGTQYPVADNLGSIRLLLDGQGNCVQRMDYAPYGAQVSRSGEPCYSSPSSGLPLFTGKMRDTETAVISNETGLDYFNARYYWAVLGRFTSPDEPFNDQDPLNPQSWNLYSYVLNNPLRYTDPDGQAHTDDNGYYVGDTNGECQKIGGGMLCWSAKNNQWETPPPPPPIITMADLNPLDDGPPLAFQGFVNLFLNGQVKRGGAQLALGILPSALVSFGAARMGGQQLFQGFQAAEAAALAAKGLSVSTAFNAGRGVINGETTGMTNHALSQALARGVTKQEIAEALTHVAKSTGGSVLKFIGSRAEVRVNQITGKIVTVIRFSSATAK
ncbi:RHS repeat domain-containing protein [Paludibaculum fermentans]|uniref:RHS repeat domain-containing protein n=1 Tax=Paludibaculum fermentans TaxID=1473598 RepID=UPI003EC1422F